MSDDALKHLLEFSRLVSSGGSVNDVISYSLDGIARILKPDMTLLYLRNGEELTLYGIRPEKLEFGEVGKEVRTVGQCLCGTAGNGTPIYTEDIHIDPLCIFNDCKKAGVRSFAAIPLMGLNEVKGVIGIASFTKRDFKKQAVFLETLAGCVTIALQHTINHAKVLASLNEIKQKNTELQKSEEELRTIFENSMDGILIADAATKQFIAGNQAICRMLGYTLEELKKLSVNDIHPKADLPSVIRQFEAQVQHKIAVAIDVPVQRKDGSVFYADVSSPIIIYDDRQCLMGMFRDVTERKKAEEVRGKLEEQLLQARKLEAVGRLAGGIAHDFNNILSVIVGYGNILKNRVNASDLSYSYAENILSAAQRGANLTTNLLAYSRKQIMQLKPLDLNEVIKSFENIILRLTGDDIQLKMVLSAKPLNIMADRGQIERVIMNLATNARDAMPHGGEIVIETGSVTVDKDYINIYGYAKGGKYSFLSFTDYGAGIDDNTLKQIFEPFFTTKDIGKGAGLGLATVYGIIKQHEGFIEVDSQVGKGTTFKVFLPLIILEPEEKEAEEYAGFYRGTETLLIAEDDAVLRDLAKLILSEAGYTVIEAADGDEALKKYRENADHISLLFLDIIIPGKGGREVFEKAKQVNPDIKVLFTSGYSEDLIQLEGITKSEINYISKPFVPNALLKKIRDVLDIT